MITKYDNEMKLEFLSKSCNEAFARIATENLKKGANGRVGIELVIEYEDGSEETRFVELY